MRVKFWILVRMWLFAMHANKGPSKSGSLSDMEYVTIKDLCAKYGVNRTTIWRWQQKQGFPDPVRFGPQTVRWKMADVTAWEASRP